MQHWSELLSSLGDVSTFDYPYVQAGRRRPDPMPVLLQAHRTVIEGATKGRTAPLVLVGKSMGSRMGCHVAAAGDDVARKVRALVCLGYPLKGASGALRDRVLLALSQPILFVQGTRDALCPLELLKDVQTRMRATSRLHVVEGGDHSLAVTKTALGRAKKTQADVDGQIVLEIERFLGEVLDAA